MNYIKLRCSPLDWIKKLLVQGYRSFIKENNAVLPLVISFNIVLKDLHNAFHMENLHRGIFNHTLLFFHIHTCHYCSFGFFQEYSNAVISED